MALPNLSTLSLDVVNTEAEEEDAFEFNEQVDQDDPFALHHDAWTAGPTGPASTINKKVRKSRRSLAYKNQEEDPLPRLHDPPYGDEPNATIPNDYEADSKYFEDVRRKKLKWGFLFRQQRYSFGPNGVRESVNLPERVTLKERFERQDGLGRTCRRSTWRGQDADVFKWTTAAAAHKLIKAIDQWHSLCYVVNGRDDVLGVMALGQLTRSVGPFGDVSVSNHQLKLPSEWINGMRKLVQQKGIHRPGPWAGGQGNYTPLERFVEVEKRKLNFYIEWVCTASYEQVKNLPNNLKIGGVGKELLEGLKQFVRKVYVEPCARAFLVEQWSPPDFEAQVGVYDQFGRTEPQVYDPAQLNTNPRREAYPVGVEGLAWAVTQIELWAFFDFIALNSAKNAWKKMDFCQVGKFQPWNEALTLNDPSGYMQGPHMFLPLVGFAHGYQCEDGYTAPAP